MTETDKPWTPPWRRGESDEDAAIKRGEQVLVSSASAWMQEALEAWSENDFRKVAALAPMAIEHFGKAALWRAAPTLVVPLSRDAEPALFALSTKPDLDDPRVKTIGLSGVLDRLGQLLQDMPIDDKARKRMVNVRNGAIHVGSPATSRQVLLDALSVCRTLMEVLGYNPRWFYGEHLRSALGLLDEKRTEVGDRVAAKRAKAARDIADIEEKLGLRYDDWVSDRELDAAGLDPEDYGLDLWGTEEHCPECGSRGRLFGRIEVEPQIQESTPIDEQSPPEAFVAGWAVEMFPEEFQCCVCELALHGNDELAEAHLPSGRHEISADDLGYDFDPATYAEDRYTKWD